jgi:hypothetical protein
LAATIPNLLNLRSGKSFAVVCSGFACQPPVSDAPQLRLSLETVLQKP